jgi:dTDP-glucose pyrophosphorylase/urease gamma subunit
MDTTSSSSALVPTLSASTRARQPSTTRAQAASYLEPSAQTSIQQATGIQQGKMVISMMNWEKTLVQPTDTLRQVLSVIDKAELQIALVVDDQKKLLGVITDGDVRRGFLAGLTLESTASKVMNPQFTVATQDMKPSAIEALMREKQLRHIPIIDENGIILDLRLLDEATKTERLPNIVVLMAGGLGERLGELTKDTPKPLLKVGDKPILEIILESFLAQGFHRFFISVNYKSQMIEDYFGDGSRWGAEIQYVRETKRLGTGGSLSLLSELPKEPFFVMNGDLLTKVNFKGMLEFHESQTQLATMAVREYDVQIPFGVTELDGHKITGLVEKPVKRFFVNAGVYVLSPQCLPLIPKDNFFDMPSLFQKLIDNGFATSSFPLHEYWLDIGRMSDFQRANVEYLENWPKSGK